jgi:hypothetical protein
MESVNTSTDETLEVIENLPLDFGAGEMLFQVQVVPTTNFDILLGRPFFMLTSCLMEDLPNGKQDMTLPKRAQEGVLIINDLLKP